MSYNAMAHRNLLFHMCIDINLHISCMPIYIDVRACMHVCASVCACVCVSLRMSVANIANITIVR